MIELKTSVLLAAALKIGALLGGSSKKDAELLYDFGRNIGLAFQLKDDFLDVYGETEVFGKEIGGDIVANKKTFMLIKAKELAKGEDLNKLNELLKSKNIERETKVVSVKEIYNKLNIHDLVKKRIEDLNQLALDYLAQVSIAENKKSELKKLAENLIHRIN